MGIYAERLIKSGVFCGIDPGREKFGLALGSVEELLFAAVIPFQKLDTALRSLASGDTKSILEWRTEGGLAFFETGLEVFLGNGTSHTVYERELQSADIRYKVIDERMTTLEARELYWKLHTPSGLRRVIPRSMRLPPRPIDDLAAWAIIKRAISE
jgi:RNase H-fold protein (predicted Holliday junction resolvase)